MGGAAQISAPCDQGQTQGKGWSCGRGRLGWILRKILFRGVGGALQGMVSRLPELQQRLDNALSHRVGLLGVWAGPAVGLNDPSVSFPT